MIDLFEIFLYLLCAILPGTIWLFYFLSKDKNPEPKKVIIKTFIIGAIVTIPVLGIEYGLMQGLESTNLAQPAFLAIKYFLIIALVEELFKYLAYRMGALKSQFMDEAIDVPIYMIIAALGFATAENILLFFQASFVGVIEPVSLSFFRFIGATLVHVLASGVFGFYLAVSYYKIEKRLKYFFRGLIIAILLHGIFDFFLKYSIMNTGGEERLTPAIAIIIVSVIAAFILLRQSLHKLNKLKSICKYEKPKH